MSFLFILDVYFQSKMQFFLKFVAQTDPWILAGFTLHLLYYLGLHYIVIQLLGHFGLSGKTCWQHLQLIRLEPVATYYWRC
jgi:hypothetical protein